MLQNITGISVSLFTVFPFSSVGSAPWVDPSTSPVPWDSLCWCFPSLSTAVPSWSLKGVLCAHEEPRPKEKQPQEKGEQQHRLNQHCISICEHKVSPIFSLCISRLGSYFLLLHHCPTRESCSQGEGILAQCVKVEAAQPGKEKAPGRTHSTFLCLKVAIKQMGTHFLAEPAVIVQGVMIEN